MSPTPRFAWPVSFGRVALFVFLFQAETAAHADALDDIVKRWQQRQDSLQSVEYECAGIGIYPKNRLDDVPSSLAIAKPTKDHEHAIVLKLLVDFRGNRLRKEKEGDVPSRGSYFRRRVLRTWDGNELRFYRFPNAVEREKIEVQTGWVRQALGGLLEVGDYLALLPHGILPPADGFVDVASQRSVLRAADFYLHGRGVIGSDECLVLRTRPTQIKGAPFHEYWVDEKLDSAIRRWTYHWNGNQLSRLDLDYQQSPDGWLPSRAEASEFRLDPQGKTVLNSVERLNVRICKLNPAVKGSDFQVPVHAGLLVTDVNKREDFLVAEDGSTLVPWTGGLIADGVRSNKRMLIVIGVSSVILLLVAAIGVRYFRRRIRSAPC